MIDEPPFEGEDIVDHEIFKDVAVFVGNVGAAIDTAGTPMILAV